MILFLWVSPLGRLFLVVRGKEQAVVQRHIDADLFHNAAVRRFQRAHVAHENEGEFHPVHFSVVMDKRFLFGCGGQVSLFVSIYSYPSWENINHEKKCQWRLGIAHGGQKSRRAAQSPESSQVASGRDKAR